MIASKNSVHDKVVDRIMWVWFCGPKKTFVFGAQNVPQEIKDFRRHVSVELSVFEGCLSRQTHLSRHVPYSCCLRTSVMAEIPNASNYYSQQLPPANGAPRKVETLLDGG